MKCEICGAELEKGELICKYCGNEISLEDIKPNAEETPNEAANEIKTEPDIYAPTPTERPIVNNSSGHNEVVINRNNMNRAMFCSKCGRPLDGRTGKCIVCDYAAVGQSAYMNNNETRKNGDNDMPGKKKKKRNTARTVILSVLGIMAIFAIAVIAAFYMMGGFNHDEETESPSPYAATEEAESATEITVTDTPRSTPASAAKAPVVTAAPAVTSNPSMEPKKGDPAEFKGGSYIYPTNKQVVTESILKSYAPTEKTARLLYYELFARYGMEFDDDDLIEYFEGQVWYTPNGGSSESKIKAQFNNVEKENERIIRKYMEDNDWD